MNQQTMVAITQIEFSEERLKEIFSVPRTKELLETLIEKLKNEEKAKELENRFKSVVEKMPDVAISLDNIYDRIKPIILVESIEEIIKGKSLNQAIRYRIRQELKNMPAILEKLEMQIEELESLTNLNEKIVSAIEGLLG